MEKKKQTIKCNVYDCRYCDIFDNFCNLKEITVSNSSQDKEKEATMCTSYSIKKD